MLSDLSFITAWQSNDQIVHARGLGGGNDQVRISVLFKARDILRDATRQQFDVLR
jgi:hypothetical protein